MTNMELLKEKIRDSGMTMTAIAIKAGMVRETLYNRLNGIGDFTASEMMGLVRALKLKNSERDAIFFAEKVE